MARRKNETPELIEKAPDWPTYWFARFDEAVESGNAELRSKAQAELRRLGYDVQFRPELKESA